jgi:hypothetical protein
VSTGIKVIVDSGINTVVVIAFGVSVVSRIGDWVSSSMTEVEDIPTIRVLVGVISELEVWHLAWLSMKSGASPLPE